MGRFRRISNAYSRSGRERDGGLVSITVLGDERGVMPWVRREAGREPAFPLSLRSEGVETPRWEGARTERY